MTNNINTIFLRLLGYDSTGAKANKSTSSSQAVNYTDQYKTSLADLETLYANGEVTATEYQQLKRELTQDYQNKQSVFDTNNNGYLTDYEAELYDDFISSVAHGSNIDIKTRVQENYNDAHNLGQISGSCSYYSWISRNEKYYKDNFDTDKDGIISTEENAIGDYKTKAELLKKIDTDGDGKLNAQEQAAYDAYNNATIYPDSSFEVLTIDQWVNKSNCVSSERATLKAQLQKFDYDGDGKLSYAEHQAMQAYMGADTKASTSAKTSVGTSTLTTVTTATTVSLSLTTTSTSATTKTTVRTDAELIAKFDLDGDGILSESEQAALEAYKSQKEESELIAKFDIDGDGVLSESEQAALSAYKTQKEESALIAKFDIDGDGVLDTAEQAALNAYKEEKENEKLMAKFDVDGNGVLDKAEQAAMNAYKEQKKQEELKNKFDIDGNGVLDTAEQAALESYNTKNDNVQETNTPKTVSETTTITIKQEIVPDEKQISEEHNVATDDTKSADTASANNKSVVARLRKMLNFLKSLLKS